MRPVAWGDCSLGKGHRTAQGYKHWASQELRDREKIYRKFSWIAGNRAGLWLNIQRPQLRIFPTLMEAALIPILLGEFDKLLSNINVIPQKRLFASCVYCSSMLSLPVENIPLQYSIPFECSSLPQVWYLYLYVVYVWVCVWGGVFLRTVCMCVSCVYMYVCVVYMWWVWMCPYGMFVWCLFVWCVFVWGVCLCALWVVFVHVCVQVCVNQSRTTSGISSPILFKKASLLLTGEYVSDLPESPARAHWDYRHELLCAWLFCRSWTWTRSSTCTVHAWPTGPSPLLNVYHSLKIVLIWH